VKFPSGAREQGGHNSSAGKHVSLSGYGRNGRPHHAREAETAGTS
jgi:hypothetical protein